MTLAPGTRLGPYEILPLLGVGGMGEVYRARDTRLERAVAIKILPALFSSDPLRRQRFEREAKAISRLNHPNICVLHDIGHQDGIDYLVMECVEGVTLAKRLEKGPLPVDHVLKFGAQIADALDKAHRAGIIHRDLKPGNIMLTSTGAKLLDFGLAKPGSALVDVATTVTRSETPVTEQGTIVGTFQYMSPEQVEGCELDGRSDIFSLGAVLYEMVTGRRAFEGKSRLSVATAILEKEPVPLSSLKPMTPPVLDHAVKKCLAKAPDERWQSASDLASELQWLSTASGAAVVSAPVSQHHTPAWIAAGALFFTLIAASVAFFRLREKPEQSPVGRFDISLQKVNFGSFNFPVISPDGEYVVIAGTGPDGKSQLWVRKLDSVTAEALPNTDGASNPFWSPDSKFIAFAAHGRLQKVALSSGSAQTLCEAPCQLSLGGAGGDWSTDGIIVTGGGDGRLYRLPATGGRPLLIAEPDSSRLEAAAGQPRFLPDGRHFLYFAGIPIAGAVGSIYVGSLDSKEHKLLGNSALAARYAPPGYLLYASGNTLVAQRFDLDRLALVGDAFPIVQVGVIQGSGLTNSFSVSQNGVLAYSPNLSLESELVWYDRHGLRLETVGARASYTNPALSPDGKKLAVAVGLPPNRNIWVFDLVRDTPSRLTFDPADDLDPAWSRDGSRILFTSNRKGQRDIYEQAANGLGTTRLVFASSQPKSVNDSSADGRYVVYDDSGSLASLWVLPMFGERIPFPFINANYWAKQAQLSPNGNYIAYSSSETGTNQVYVETFPEHTGKWQISTDGGFQPQWRADGKELFYLAGKMTSVAVSTTSGEFKAGIPEPLFDTPNLPGLSYYRNTYVVSRDGQRFLFTASPRETTATFEVLVNWPALLKKK
jgi:serine/threonine protein kinase